VEKLGCGVSATSNQNIKEVTHVEQDKEDLHDVMQKWAAKSFNIISEQISSFSQ
jgi:hypothetical protein